MDLLTFSYEQSVFMEAQKKKLPEKKEKLKSLLQLAEQLSSYERESVSQVQILSKTSC